MMRDTRIKHQFVEYIPEYLEPSVLYISMKYATAVHSCCCGCNEEVVTPFTPTDWKMIFDGKTVSLSPSIGNWSFACRSHYFIHQGKVVQAEPWTNMQVENSRRQDQVAKAFYFETVEPSQTTPEVTTILEAPKPRLSFIGRHFNRLRNLWHIYK